MRRWVVLGSAILVATACAGTPITDVQVVTVFGPYRGVEADRFVESMRGFTDRTGSEV
jgi:hypothetical protein